MGAIRLLETPALEAPARIDSRPQLIKGMADQKKE
jgi:hypothetical protein